MQVSEFAKYCVSCYSSNPKMNPNETKIPLGPRFPPCLRRCGRAARSGGTPAPAFSHCAEGVGLGGARVGGWGEGEGVGEGVSKGVRAGVRVRVRVRVRMGARARARACSCHAGAPDCLPAPTQASFSEAQAQGHVILIPFQVRRSAHTNSAAQTPPSSGLPANVRAAPCVRAGTSSSATPASGSRACSCSSRTSASNQCTT